MIPSFHKLSCLERENVNNFESNWTTLYTVVHIKFAFLSLFFLYFSGTNLKEKHENCKIWYVDLYVDTRTTTSLHSQIAFSPESVEGWVRHNLCPRLYSV